jgi:SpoIIAA-like
MITIEHDRENYLVCRVSGRLSEADYEAAIPEIENELELHDEPLRMMVVLEDFRGFDLAALWKDLKFDVKHGNDFGRIAVLGDSKMEEWGTALSNPLFRSEVRFFDIADRPAARAWLSEGRAPQAARTTP